MAMTFCQKTVLGLLLFHLQDEPALAGWQSGLYYADGTAKTSLYLVRVAVFVFSLCFAVDCSGFQLTLKVTLNRGKTTNAGLPVTINCSLDCSYVLRLDAGGTLKGRAVGSTPKTVLFHGHLRPGAHVVTATATATMNAGPPRTVRLAFRL
jgi:hypothetical protein